MIGHANYMSSFIQLNELVFASEHSVIYFYEPNLFLPGTYLLFSKKTPTLVVLA